MCQRNWGLIFCKGIWVSCSIVCRSKLRLLVHLAPKTKRRDSFWAWIWQGVSVRWWTGIFVCLNSLTRNWRSPFICNGFNFFNTIGFIGVSKKFRILIICLRPNISCTQWLYYGLNYLLTCLTINLYTIIGYFSEILLCFGVFILLFGF